MTADIPAPRAGGSMALALLVAGTFFMENLDSTVITPALPAMAVSFAAPPVALNIGVSAYMLTLGVFIPVSGWVAGRFGARGRLHRGDRRLHDRLAPLRARAQSACLRLYPRPSGDRRRPHGAGRAASRAARHAQGPADRGDRDPHLAGARRARAGAAAWRPHRRPRELALDLLSQPAARTDRPRARLADRAEVGPGAGPPVRLAGLPPDRQRSLLSHGGGRDPRRARRGLAASGGRFNARGGPAGIGRAPPAHDASSDDRHRTVKNPDLRGDDLGRFAVPHGGQRRPVPSAGHVPDRVRLQPFRGGRPARWPCSPETS